MTEVQHSTTLRELVREPESYFATVVIEGHDAVVLGYGNDGWIEVCHDNAISSYEPGAAVLPLADPVRQAAVLRSALVAITDRQVNTLAAIRLYAIEKYQDGSICQEGLNEFLRAFDLEEYEG
jgi:hypothetical protein